MSTSPIPIVCDMTGAPDTAEERLAEYRTLFGAHLTGRERTATGIRFHFSRDDGLAEQIRDLAARERACCAFFDFAVVEHDDEITWDATVVDDPLARQILEEYYELPVTAYDSTEELFERFAERGLDIVIDDNGTMRAATKDEVGLISSSRPAPRSTPS